MVTKEKRTKGVSVVLVLASLLLVLALATAGDLEPSGPPAPTMKTLDEVEPRIPLHASDLPLDITVPGSYYLVEDVHITSTTRVAIFINCDNVTIDLMGFTLKGPDSGTKSGIEVYARGNVEIRNGTVRDFGTFGVIGSFDNAKEIRVIGVRAISNGIDGIYLNGYGHLVKDCTASENVRHGIWADYGSTVTGNTCRGNGEDSIKVLYSCTIIGNTCYENGGNGINAIFDGSTIIGNTVRSNPGYGIYADSYCLIDQNTAYSNGTNIYAGTGCVLGTNCAP